MSRTATATTVRPQGRTEKAPLEPYVRPNLAKGMIQHPKTQAKASKVSRPKGTEGYEEVGTSFNPMFHFKNAGDFIKGAYVSLRPDVGADPDNDRRGSNIYTLKVGQGAQEELIDVWGKTTLDKKMALVELLREVTIIFTGMEPSKRPGVKDYYNFTVLVRPTI